VGQSVRFLDLGAGWRELEPDLTSAFQRVVDRGPYVLGPEVDAFEQEFAAAVGVDHCVGVGNGFDALQLVLRAWGIGEGDEVIVPAMTAVATWTAVSFTGATPVGVDVDPDTVLMDVERVEAAITSKTKAIVPVHLYGQPVDVAAIADIARSHGLRVLEDAAQAHGASRGGKAAGSLADAAAFSFYPTKNLGAMGDGGAVTTDDAQLADAVRMMRTYGWTRKDNPEIQGVNSRLDELQAAFLRLKLARLEDWTDRRRRLAGRYLDALSSMDSLTLPGVGDPEEPAWHLFVIAHEARDAVREGLARLGVGTLVHYPLPPHRTALYAGSNSQFPVAERVSETVLSLPLYPQMPEASQDIVVEGLRSLA